MKALKSIMLLVVIYALISTSVQADTFRSSFDDVSESAWYHDYVLQICDFGFMSGFNDNEFRPNNLSTRAQAIQVLYKVANTPDVQSDISQFSDVKANSYYYNAALWGKENGIVTGYEDQTFRPNRRVTREELICMCYHLSLYQIGELAYSDWQDADVDKFEDFNDVSAFAEDAVKWAVKYELISGTQKGLEPKRAVTRAELATIALTYFRYWVDAHSTD